MDLTTPILKGSKNNTTIMRLVTRNFYRPTRSYFPTLWNSFLADDFFTKRALDHQKALAKRATTPAVNIKEREADFLLEVAAPGFSKKDFAVEYDKGVLTIKGEHKATEEQEEKDTYTRKEFVSSTFERSFTLNEEKVDVDQISANYEAGVLKVTIAKKEQEETKYKIDVH